jgi:hypothetical protein
MPRYRNNPETGQKYIFNAGAGKWQEMSESQIRVAGATEQAPVLMGIASAASAAVGLGLVSEEARALEQSSPLAATAGGVATVAGAPMSAFGRMSARVLARRAAEKTALPAVEGAASGLRTQSGMIKGLQDVVPESFRGAARTAEAVPGASLLTGMRGMYNRGLAGKSLGRWMGMSDELVARSKGKLTDDVMEEMLSETDDMYRSISGTLDEKVALSQFDEMVDGAVKRKVMIADKAEDWKALEGSMGEKIIALRSELRAQARGNVDTVEKQNLEKAIQNIQKIIDDSVKGTDAEGISKLADTRYSRWMALKGSQAIETGTGNVRRASLDQVLRKRDARMMMGKRDGMDAETADLVQAMKDWRSVGDPLPSSGSAERALGMSLLGSAVGVNIF